MISKLVLPASLLLSVAIAHGAHAAIVNGSFEAPVVPAGGAIDFTVGSGALTGWSVFGPQGAIVSIVSTSYTQDGISFIAQDGAQWLDLTGPGSNMTAGVQQTVATTPGTAYDLSFYVGNVSGGVFGSTSTVGVLIDGVLVASKTNATPGTTQNWQLFDVVFTAASGFTVIGFENLDPSTDNSNGLDNISLSLAVPAQVPEPASLALFATGIAGLGMLRRTKGKR